MYSHSVPSRNDKHYTPSSLKAVDRREEGGGIKGGGGDFEKEGKVLLVVIGGERGGEG